MKKILKFGVLVLILAFIVIQFFRPDRISINEVTSDDITKKMQVPDNVHSIFKRSCYDCHSNHTKWPWYSNVAPVSWLVADDVRKARKKMNFSEWGKMSMGKQEKNLTSICDEISEEEMPLPNYLILHGDAKLTQQDKDAICNWIKSLGIESEDDDEKEKK